jgi:hypothetical protein
MYHDIYAVNIRSESVMQLHSAIICSIREMEHCKQVSETHKQVLETQVHPFCIVFIKHKYTRDH